MKMLKYILGFLLVGSIAVAAGKFQNSDFATEAQITGAGGAISQLLNTSKIYDNVNAQLLNTTIAAKATNPMTTAEDIIKGGASGAPTRLAVGSNGQCLVVSGGAVAWGACGTSSPLTTKGDLYTYDTGNQRLAVGTNGQILSANSATATGLEWISATGGDAIQKAINQTAHGLAVGDVIRHNGTSYIEAQADADANSEVFGIVSAVADANNFTVITSGYISGLSGLTAGAAHFLSAATAGAITATEPTGASQISKPVLVAVSTSAGYVIHSRGYIVGGSGGSGSGVTNWVASSATVNCSSAGTTELFERMEGDSLRIRGTFSCTTAGSGTPSINIGGGRTFATSKMQTIAPPRLGDWVALTGGSNVIYNQVQEGHLFYDLSDNDDVFFATTRASKSYTKVTNFGSIFGSTNTEAMNVDFLVPLN
jgi:hypothetical protein